MKTKEPIQFTDENIQKIFGYEDAESEPIERLRQYYFKNEIFARVVADLPIRILVGHKGIGKSALFKIAIAEDQENGNLPILIKPDDIAELAEKRDENFLLTIRKWKFGLIEIIGKKVLSEFGMNDDGFSGKIIQFGGKIMSLISDSVTSLKDKINIKPTQKILLDSFLKKNKIIVYIDDLDRGWQGKKDDITRISALLNCIRDMCNENLGLYFRVSLRSDVFYAVRTSDESTDKIESAVIWHSWTNHEILVMLVKRIFTYDKEQIDERQLLKTTQAHVASHLTRVMEKTFHGRGKWENVPTYKVLMSLIRRRPRDLVKLCTLAARKAYVNKRNIISADDFQSIFEEYSTGRMTDTENEFKSELPDIKRLLYGMKPSKKGLSAANSYVLNTPELHLKINNIIERGKFYFANGQTATAKELSHFLYKINFLTARKQTEDGFIHRKYFEENQYLSSTFSDFGYDWEIHPAYRWALQPDSINDIYSKLILSSDN